MANVQCPGFIPLRSTVAGATIGHKRMRVLTNNTTAIAKGDAVVIGSDGAVVVSSSATAAIGSIAQGASYVDATDGIRKEKNWLPATTLYTSSGVDPENASFVYIVDDCYNTVFEASIDEAVALTDMGLNYKIVLGTLSTNGYSGHELDATSRAVTATGLPVRVHDFIRGRAGHDPDAADAHVECRINLGLIEPALSQEEGE